MIKKLLKILSNPILSTTGWILAILGMVTTYYFYQTPYNRELCYLIKPIRAIILRSEYSSKINIRYDDNIVKKDLTAAQITLWNNGKEAIKSENILDAIIIYTENNTPVLEAKIVSSTRKVTGAVLNTEFLQNGAVKLTWDILEQNDGVTIQVIYEGDPEVPILVKGVVEGQRRINHLQTPEQTIYRREFNRPLRKAFEAEAIFIVFASFVMMGIVILMSYKSARIFGSIVVLILLISSSFVIYHLLYGYVEPPFGF